MEYDSDLTKAVNLVILTIEVFAIHLLVIHSF